MTTSETELDSDRGLVEAARTSREAFGKLYDRYVVRIYRYAYRRTGTHQDAEDVTSETFRRALEHLDRYRWAGAPFGAWLHRIASNLVVERYRKACPIEPLQESPTLTDSDPLPEQALLAAEKSRSLWSMVGELPVDQRRAVVMRFSHGLSGREIAVRMGRSEGAVKQLLHRAMLALREKVRAEGYGR